MNIIGIRFQAGTGLLSLFHRIQTGFGVHAGSHLIPGAISLEVKRQGHEADHLLPSSAEFK
jgi:hypothetical protein